MAHAPSAVATSDRGERGLAIDSGSQRKLIAKLSCLPENSDAARGHALKHLRYLASVLPRRGDTATVRYVRRETAGLVPSSNSEALARTFDSQMPARRVFARTA
jgi:hypothetical protein